MPPPNTLKTFLATFLHYCIILVMAITVGPLMLAWNYISIKSELGLETDPESHAGRVVKVQAQVNDWLRVGRIMGQKMATGRPAWKSIAKTKIDKSKYFQVSMNLNQILRLDEKKMTVTVEPGVMTGQLSRYLFRRNWTIAMVPELETLSIGGLICGFGVETSGHKLGYFHDTVFSYEVVLPNGKVVTCSKENDPDLFYSIPGSLGTICFVTAITIPVIPAKRNVKVDYRPVSSILEFYAVMKSEPNHDYVEGFAFSKTKLLLVFGDLDDGCNIDDKATNKIRVNHVNRWYKIPYYKQAQGIMDALLNNPSTNSSMEYIPLIDYYHRHSRAFYWLFDGMAPALYSPISLMFLGWMLPINLHMQRLAPRWIYEHFTRGQVIQDYAVPVERAEEFFQTADKLLKIYPVWLCAVKVMKTRCMLVPRGKPEMGGDYLGLGYYACPEAEGFSLVTTLKTLEKMCIQLKGFQASYGESFMTREEFLEMCDTCVYDQVRKKYGCEAAFPHVYDKGGPKARNLDKLVECKEEDMVQ